VSNFNLNLAVLVPDGSGKKERFVRIKVPDNRPRWVPLEDGRQGFVPLEQVIAANLTTARLHVPLSRSSPTWQIAIRRNGSIDTRSRSSLKMNREMNRFTKIMTFRGLHGI
jgi:polyphosphate kinase